MIDRELDKKILAAVRKASSMSLENFERGIFSYFNTDLKDANRNVESIHALKIIYGDINNMVLKQDTLLAILVGYIAERIRRTGEYAWDISTVIKYVNEKGKVPLKEKSTL